VIEHPPVSQHLSSGDIEAPVSSVSAAHHIDWALRTKAIVDAVLAALAIALLSPLLLTIALIVRLGSPGSVIYRRRVMGQHGTQFDAFKFRTMRVDGDAILEQHPALKAQLARDHKLADDPRIARYGSMLRKLSLDELPQLFNVLRGEMSLIGPRMISPPELTRYGADAGELLSLKPGISGLWQVSGRSTLAPEDRVRLDIQYVRTRTLLMDVGLMIKTIPAVLKSRGAV
jgi:lipopolysaccharide/colanic/teichoic acid biosynthesis glycosyltransferase